MTMATSTTTQQNKVIAYEFFSRFSEGDIDGAVALMSHDATWWLSGQPSMLPSAGLYTKDEITILFGRMLKRMRGRLIKTITNLIAERDKVAIEVESTGELHNGRSYHNQYHILMRISDGLIREVREYNDTQHSYDVWFRED